MGHFSTRPEATAGRNKASSALFKVENQPRVADQGPATLLSPGKQNRFRANEMKFAVFLFNFISVKCPALHFLKYSHMAQWCMRAGV